MQLFYTRSKTLSWIGCPWGIATFSSASILPFFDAFPTIIYFSFRVGWSRFVWLFFNFFSESPLFISTAQLVRCFIYPTATFWTTRRAVTCHRYLPFSPPVLCAYVYSHIYTAQHSHLPCFHARRLASNLLYTTFVGFNSTLCYHYIQSIYFPNQTEFGNHKQQTTHYWKIVSKPESFVVQNLLAGSALKRLTPLQLETRFWGQNYLDLV